MSLFEIQTESGIIWLRQSHAYLLMVSRTPSFSTQRPRMPRIARWIHSLGTKVVRASRSNCGGRRNI